MDENKKSKAASISIGMIILCVFLAFGFLIGFTQTRGAQNLNRPAEESPYADFYFNNSGELIYYAGDEKEVVVPEYYSLDTIQQTREITGTNVSDLENIANRLNLKDYSIEVKTDNATNGYGSTTEYVLKFKFYSAVEGGEIATTSIGQYAFRDNTKVTKIELPNSVLTIRDNAFYGCNRLQQIELPDTINYIGQYAFQNCSSLTSIKIPANVTQIYYGTFQYCSNLETVEMHNNITDISSQAFYYCRRLKNVNFSNSLQRIESSAFYNCGFTEIELPESVYYLGSNVFYANSSLSKVVLRMPNTISGNSDPFSYYSNLKIYVPDEYMEQYRQSYPWSQYTSYLHSISELGE